MDTKPKTAVNKTILITGATSGLGLVTASELGRLGRTWFSSAAIPTKQKPSSLKYNPKPATARWIFCWPTFLRFIKSAYLPANSWINTRAWTSSSTTRAAFGVGADFTEDGLEMTIGVNHVATFLLTQQLLDMLKASSEARIVNVSSEAHRFGKFDFDNLLGERHYGGYWQYCRSKLMNLLFTYELARQLQGTSVTVNALHPGWATTNIAANYGWKKWFFNAGAFFFGVSAEKGARTEIYLASSPEVVGISGKYFAWQKEVTSSKRSYDEALAKRLWQWTTEMASRGA